jgi:hypothetical protein
LRSSAAVEAGNVLASFVMPKYATVEEVTLIDSGVRPPLLFDGLPCKTATFGWPGSKGGD